MHQTLSEQVLLALRHNLGYTFKRLKSFFPFILVIKIFAQINHI